MNLNTPTINGDSAPTCPPSLKGVCAVIENLLQLDEVKRQAEEAELKARQTLASAQAAVAIRLQKINSMLRDAGGSHIVWMNEDRIALLEMSAGEDEPAGVTVYRNFTIEFENA